MGEKCKKKLLSKYRTMKFNKKNSERKNHKRFQSMLVVIVALRCKEKLTGNTTYNRTNKIEMSLYFNILLKMFNFFIPAI